MSDSNPASRALVTRLVFGVSSIGAALGLVYLYYNYQRSKDASADSTTSKRKRRVTSGGENRNRVTFAEENEIIGTSSTPSQQTENRDNNKEEELLAKVVANHTSGENESIPPPLPLSPAPELKLEVRESKPEVEVKKTEPQQIEAVITPSIATKTEAKQEVLVVEPEAVTTNGHPASGVQKPAITPETDYDQTSMTRELKIPKDHVPGLIGKKGVNIRAIQNSSNTEIKFKDETLENGDRVCLIRGQPKYVTVAESMIEKFILEQPLITTHTMSIPNSSVGRIIGKGGESIRAIQDLSRAKVTVDTQSNHFHHHSHKGDGDGASVKMVSVSLRGTEEQINTARQMIIEKVEEEKTLRRNIDMATQNRTPRRPTTSVSSNSPGRPSSQPVSTANGNSLPLRNNGIMEVFVSCAYHPNDFWIQVMGRESIELDKLTECMTEWFSQYPKQPEEEISVGDIIAAPFDVDGKMYRGKILKIDEDEAEVIYVDYGDKRTLKQIEIRRIHPEFLKLRFQAIQATLNLGCIGERWTDEVIGEFCDLTYCAQWQSLTAKVKDYLKDPEQKDTIWIELLDKNVNIGDELIRRGLASSSSAESFAAGSSGASSNNSRKSYASVVVAADGVKPSQVAQSPTEEVSDNGQVETWEDEYNGN